MTTTAKMPGTARAPNLGRYKHDTLFCVGQKVMIDDDEQMSGTVIRISIHAGGTDYCVAYFNNGTAYEPMIDEFRLTAR